MPKTVMRQGRHSEPAGYQEMEMESETHSVIEIPSHGDPEMLVLERDSFNWGYGLAKREDGLLGWTMHFELAKKSNKGTGSEPECKGSRFN